MTTTTTFNGTTVGISSLAAASTTVVSRTSCTTEAGCNSTNSECCVYSAYTFNGATVRSTGGFCASEATFLEKIQNHTVNTISTTSTAWPLKDDQHCFREANPLVYAEMFDSSANFFAFSMAVIFGLLALFAY
jgi:hypothetical protein